MVGRKEGSDIVQLGKSPDGNLIRWSFREITPESFRWRGEVSVDGGTTWRLDVEFLAAPPPARRDTQWEQHGWTDARDRSIASPGSTIMCSAHDWARAASPGASGA